MIWMWYSTRVSTDLTEQISRIFQEEFLKKSRTCLHCFGPICNVPNALYLMEHVMMSSNQRSSLCYSTDYNINNIFILHSSMHKQCHIINFRSLHKNFQEDHLNSRFPGFPGVVDTLRLYWLHSSARLFRWRESCVCKMYVLTINKV